MKNKGIDTKQKIVDASGARPILRNTLPQEIAQFRKQITIHDFLHCDDINTLKKEIRSLNSLNSVPYEHGLYVRIMVLKLILKKKRTDDGIILLWF